MNTKFVMAGLLIGTIAIPTAAQQPAVSDRMAQAMPSRYSLPLCVLKPGHSKVSRGLDYLKTGIENKDPANRARALTSGQKVLVESIEKDGQDKNPAAWYYLGRTYLQQGDIAGADTALIRAEGLAPACKEEISNLRYMGWVPLVNAGIGFTKEQKNDSALALFRQANTIYRDKPQAYSAAAVVMVNMRMDDSAIVYLQKAVEVATAADMAQERNQATFNLAAVLQRANRNDEAVATMQRYLGWVPSDIEAKMALAKLYRASGKIDSATTLEQELLAAPGAGQGANGASAMGTDDINNIGVHFYNERKYAEAATAFEKVLASEPNNRDALFNLSNTYLALKNWPRLLATADRLATIEPMYENSLKLQAEGNKQIKKIDSAVKIAERVVALPINLEVTNFSRSGTHATLDATATGRQPKTPTGKPIAPTPLTVVFEFLDQQGTPVATQEAQIPPLTVGAIYQIKLNAQGTGIKAWRYKRK